MGERDEAKLSESNEASPGMMNYNYNVLMSLNQNAIILTCGDNDTYPLWELQAKGIRPDVIVLNLSLLAIKEYRDKIFNELGIPATDTNAISAIEKLQLKISPKHSEIYFFKSMLKLLTSLSKQRLVYIGLTVDLVYSKEIDDNLYLVGMAYEYNDMTVDKIAKLRYNFEHLYNLDYLSNHFYDDISSDLVKMINENYLAPMNELYLHYKYSGDVQKEQWIKAKMMDIAREADQEKKWNDYFQTH